VRIAILIQYEGSNYRGWQIQPGLPTVQGSLEKALEKVFGSRIGIVGSGRTDAGVHALGQVAHFHIEKSTIPAANIWMTLNPFLPEDIRVISSCEVVEAFHSRFKAVQREYRYAVTTEQNVLRRNTCWLVRYPLDFSKLENLAGQIIGRHDFSSFCYAGSETENMICHISEAYWERGSDKQLSFSIKADRFLHHMVRMLVGTMIEVARGKWQIKQFAKLLDHPDRQNHTVTAPAEGLVLQKVSYPEAIQPDWPIIHPNLVSSNDAG